MALDDPLKGGLRVQGSVMEKKGDKIFVKLDGRETIWSETSKLENITPVLANFSVLDHRAGKGYHQ